MAAGAGHAARRVAVAVRPQLGGAQAAGAQEPRAERRVALHGGLVQRRVAVEVHHPQVEAWRDQQKKLEMKM